MGSFGPLDVAHSFLGKPASAPTPDRPGCCGVIAAGILIGLFLGGWLGAMYGIWIDSAIADEAERRGEFFDGLPMGFQTFGALGGVLGAILGPLFLGLGLFLKARARVPLSIRSVMVAVGIVAVILAGERFLIHEAVELVSSGDRYIWKEAVRAWIVLNIACIVCIGILAATISQITRRPD